MMKLPKSLLLILSRWKRASLYRDKRSMLDEMFLLNTLKFVVLLGYENSYKYLHLRIARYKYSEIENFGHSVM